MENPLLRLNGTAIEQQQNSNRISTKHQQNINKTSGGENNMSIKVIFQTARCITFEIQDGSIFEFQKEREIYVNGKFYKKTNRVINSIYDLKPDTRYEILVKDQEEESMVFVKTDHEFVTLNVRDFGAKGDGIQDDTHFIQAAILCCPKESRVLIPAGTYKITSLFLRDDLRLELAEGAVLSAETDRTKFPVLKGLIDSYDEKEEYNLGTWSKLEHPSIFFRSLAFLGYVCDQPKSISEYGWLGPGVLS